MAGSRVRRVLWENSLSIVLFVVFVAILVAHSVAGHRAGNDEAESHGQPPLDYVEYLTSGEYAEAVFENWESEFLQMAAYVLITVYLVQKGSAESKLVDDDEAADRDPERSADPDSPWPVRRGGWVLKLYENSLSLAFLVLFLLSFALHAWGGARQQCDENREHGEQTCQSTVEYARTSTFWAQSLENWQSEFLAVGSIVVLSIYLRQRGSPESKPVDTPHAEQA